jgi:hypothetical protein
MRVYRKSYRSLAIPDQLTSELLETFNFNDLRANKSWSTDSATSRDDLAIVEEFASPYTGRFTARERAL